MDNDFDVNELNDDINDAEAWREVDRLVHAQVGDQMDMIAMEVVNRVDHKYRMGVLMVAHFFALRVDEESAFTLIGRLAIILNEDMKQLLEDGYKVAMAIRDHVEANSTIGRMN